MTPQALLRYKCSADDGLIVDQVFSSLDIKTLQAMKLKGWLDV